LSKAAAGQSMQWEGQALERGARNARRLAGGDGGREISCLPEGQKAESRPPHCARHQGAGARGARRWTNEKGQALGQGRRRNHLLKPQREHVPQQQKLIARRRWGEALGLEGGRGQGAGLMG
jgi:hypothetical protein